MRYEVIYDYEDDYGRCTLSEKFHTREDALDWIDQMRRDPYMSNFDLIDTHQE